jgi:hypothetical protein
MRFPMAVLAGFCLVCVACGVDAGETSASPEQIATWVKQLGSDDFDAREKAEVELAKAGLAALAELQKAAQTNDPEIRTRSARLLELLKWSTMPKIADLTSVLPPENIFYMGTPSMKDAMTRIRKETPLGRLYDHAGLVPLRDTLWEMGLQSAGWDDQGRKLADQWLDRFGGPYGMAFIHSDRTKAWPEREQFAFFVGINGTNPKVEMEAYQKYLPFLSGNTVPQVYRGVNCNFLEQDWRKDGMALVKNLIVRSNGKAAMFNVIDAAMDEKRTGLADTPAYKEARSKVSGEPLAMLFFNVQSMMDSVFTSDRDKAAAVGLGFQEWKYAIVTLGIQDGLFLEQAVCKLDGQRRGLGQLLSLTPVTGRLAALCPPDALLFVSIPVDGKLLLDGIVTMVETVDPRDGKQLREQVEALNQPEPQEAFTARYQKIQDDAEKKLHDLELQVRAIKNPTAEQRSEFDRKMGAEQERKEDAIRRAAAWKPNNGKAIDTLVGALKGEAALWLLHPQGTDPTAMPQTCLALEAVDAAAATKAADTLAKLLPLVADKEDFVGKAEYQGRTCYFMQPKEKRNRWEPDLFWSWCADGARILIGQRQEVLQKMLLRSTQAAKGLDAQPDFQKLLAAIPQDERGGLAYANASEVLTWAYTVGLPALSADAPEDVKAKLAQLPKDPQALFKEFPGTMLSVRGAPDGVRARAVGGVPATAWTTTVPFAFYYTMRVAMQEEMINERAKAAAAAAEEKAVEEKEAAEKPKPVEKKAAK